jgi:hydroxymethylglutaryl-CoA lyase
MSKRLYIQEVATRDGFQIEADFVPTEAKIALIDRLSQTGLAKIEVTSFTSPKAIPNLRDAEDVMRGIRRAEGVEYTVLVPNVKGCERALACEVDEINLVMSASDTHGLANLRMTPEQSLVQFREIIEVTRGSGVFINASLSTTFGCPSRAMCPSGASMSWCNACWRSACRASPSATPPAWPTRRRSSASAAKC